MASTDFEKLQILLAVRDKEFARQLERNTRRVDQFAKRSSRGLSRTTQSFNLMTVAARRLLPALSAGALLAATKKVVTSLDNIGKTADKLGLTTSALQELRASAEVAGVSVTTFDMAMQRFGRRVAEARNGSGEAKAALEEMGIALFDASGNAREIEDVLGSVADAFSEVTDQTDMNRLAMKLFDSEGVAMVNMLRSGQAELDKTREEMRKLGVVIDEDLIRKAEGAQSQIDALSRVIGANLSTALINLAPILVSITELMATFSAKAAGVVSDIQNMGANMDLVNSYKDVQDTVDALADVNAQLEAISLNPVPFGENSLLEERVRLETQLADQRERLEKARTTRFPDQGNTDSPVTTPDAGNVAFDTGLSSAWDRIEQLVKETELAGLSTEAQRERRIELEAGALAEELLAKAVADGSEVSDEEAAAVARVIEEYKAQALALAETETAQRGVNDARERSIEKIKEEEDALSELEAANQRVIENFIDIIAGADNLQDALQGVLKMALKLAATSFLQGLFGVSNSNTGSLGNFFYNAGAGLTGKASGGSVMAGRSYMVGEHGREPFVPAQNGRILSVAQAKSAVGGGGGGGGDVIQNFYISTGVQDTVRAELLSMTPQFEALAQRAVLGANSRGGSFRRSLMGG